MIKWLHRTGTGCKLTAEDEWLFNSVGDIIDERRHEVHEAEDAEMWERLYEGHRPVRVLTSEEVRALRTGTVSLNKTGSESPTPSSETPN